MAEAEMNSIFREFALMFIGRIAVAEDVPFGEKLNRSALDGSIESLHVVDDYLSYVREHLQELTDADYSNLALRGGGYVGECIRMTWPESYTWSDYNDYMPTHPRLTELMPERNLGNCAMLVRNPDSMILPVNKILRFLEEGPENSVHFFAQCEKQYHN